MQQRKGTMLVISDAAETEATRLASQAILVEGVQLDAKSVRLVSAIDGAVLVDRDCRCRALGVILDGIAQQGDPSRGARYNSAIRYIESTDVPTICLVVSEDGYVDMIPQLLPQVSKQLIAKHVEDLCAMNLDTSHQTRNWLGKHRFYLTSAQCDVVNRELARIDAEPREGNWIKFEVKSFEPNAGMNDSYYLESGPE